MWWSILETGETELAERMQIMQVIVNTPIGCYNTLREGVSYAMKKEWSESFLHYSWLRFSQIGLYPKRDARNIDRGRARKPEIGFLYSKYASSVFICTVILTNRSASSHRYTKRCRYAFCLYGHPPYINGNALSHARSRCDGDSQGTSIIRWPREHKATFS